MLTRVRTQLGYANVMATLAACAAIGAAALAAGAIPGGDGSIAGCYSKRGGRLRVVEAGSDCRKNERPITWAQQGPRGETGDPGTALAYARVNGTAPTGGDTVDGAYARNVADVNVTHPAAGKWCFDGLSFAPKNIVATVDVVQAGATEVIQAGIAPGGACVGKQAMVEVLSAGTPIDSGFFVQIN
jgi:hypothetical protein